MADLLSGIRDNYSWGRASESIADALRPDSALSFVSADSEEGENSEFVFYCLGGSPLAIEIPRTANRRTNSLTGRAGSTSTILLGLPVEKASERLYSLENSNDNLGIQQVR